MQLLAAHTGDFDQLKWEYNALWTWDLQKVVRLLGSGIPASHHEMCFDLHSIYLVRNVAKQEKPGVYIFGMHQV
jgi:hypothetical protein